MPAIPRRRHACCPTSQRMRSPQTPKTRGRPRRSRAPQPDVQVSGARLPNDWNQWLTIQPTPGRPDPYGQSRVRNANGYMPIPPLSDAHSGALGGAAEAVVPDEGDCRFLMPMQESSRARRSPRLSRGRFPSWRRNTSTCCRRASIPRCRPPLTRRSTGEQMAETSRRARHQSIPGGSTDILTKSSLAVAPSRAPAEGRPPRCDYLWYPTGPRGAEGATVPAGESARPSQGAVRAQWSRAHPATTGAPRGIRR